MLSARGGRDATSKGSVQVFVRLRPLLDHERPSASAAPNAVGKDGGGMLQYDVTADGNGLHIHKARKNMSTAGDTKEVSKFNFNKVFNHDAQTPDVHDTLFPEIAAAVMGGYNASLLSYGQTGSGKTHTMRGLTKSVVDQLWGIVDDGGMSDVTVEVSALQIYMDTVYNMLPPAPTSASSGSTPAGKTPVSAATLTAQRRGEVVDVRATNPVFPRQQVTSTEETLSVLKRAESKRTVGGHALNSVSSRSHYIAVLHVTHGKAFHSKIYLVDLAGSERVARTKADGEMFEEGKAVNKSLMTLSKCMEALAVASERQAKLEAATLAQTTPGAFVGSPSASPQRRHSTGGLPTSSTPDRTTPARELFSMTTPGAQQLASTATPSSGLNLLAQTPRAAPVIPYRENVLTIYLQDCFSNGYLALVCCCSPADVNEEETRSTLHFGHLARRVQINRRQNELIHQRKALREKAEYKYAEREKELKAELQAERDNSARLAQQLSSKSRECKQLTDDHRRMAYNLALAKKSALQSQGELVALAERCAALERERDAARSEVADLRKTKEELAKSIANLEGDLQLAQLSLEKAELQLLASRASYGAERDELVAAQKNIERELKQRKEELAAERIAQEDIVRELEGELSVARQSIHDAEAELKMRLPVPQHNNVETQYSARGDSTVDGNSLSNKLVGVNKATGDDDSITQGWGEEKLNQGVVMTDATTSTPLRSNAHFIQQVRDNELTTFASTGCVTDVVGDEGLRNTKAELADAYKRLAAAETELGAVRGQFATQEGSLDASVAALTAALRSAQDETTTVNAVADEYKTECSALISDKALLEGQLHRMSVLLADQGMLLRKLRARSRWQEHALLKSMEIDGYTTEEIGNLLERSGGVSSSTTAGQPIGNGDGQQQELAPKGLEDELTLLAELSPSDTNKRLVTEHTSFAVVGSSSRSCSVQSVASPSRGHAAVVVA